jgi:predicted AAA+ superfamily ATPase
MNTEEWSDKPKKLEGGFIFAPYLPYSETPEADEQEFYKKYGKTMNMHQAAAYASEDKLVKKSLNLFFGIEEKEETKETKVIEKDSREIQFPITSKQEYFIYSVIIKKTFDSAKKSFTGYGKSTSIQVGYDEYVTAPINGFFFINDPDGNIICFEFNAEFYTIHIKSETTFVNDLYNVIISEFENNNFYKFKNMEVTQNGVKFHKPNHATFESVILDKKLKDDIYLNSIYFLENFDGSNGMIFEGSAGGGKSLMCAAIVNEAIKKKFTTLFITERIDLDFLRDFIEKIIGNCVIIFEDIDSIAQSRKDTMNTGIASLLQLISGISDIKSKILFIATTNHLEQLDDAIKNRPMRFNRKYHFDFPKEKEIDELLKLYFGDIQTDNKICYNQKFHGSHVKELRRSFNLEKTRSKDMSDIDIFRKVVEIVKDNFETTSSTIGFEKPVERKSGFLG